MVVVVKPMFSQKASGSIADTLTVRCGSVIYKKIMSDTDNPFDDDLTYMQRLFQLAAKTWKNLPPEIKEEWKHVIWRSVVSPICLAMYFTYPLLNYIGVLGQTPGEGQYFKFGKMVLYLLPWQVPMYMKILLGIAGLLASVRAIYSLDGYQLWMSCFLVTRGLHWDRYPHPPPAFDKLESF